MKRVVKNQNTVFIEDAVKAKTVFVENIITGDIGIIVKKSYTFNASNCGNYFVRFPNGGTRFGANYNNMESLIENLIDDNYRVYVK